MTLIYEYWKLYFKASYVGHITDIIRANISDNNTINNNN